jgi:hypothetical protein
MKKFRFLFFSLSILIMQSCAQFEPAECELNVDYNPDSVWTECHVTIKDDGGCSYFTEQGYCIGFFQTPSLIDDNSTVEMVNSGVEQTGYSWKMKLTEIDTTYYIRAYVKTNAGTGYSNIVSVTTP